MGNVRVRKETNNLFFDFYFMGVRCREQTLLPDTPANRKKLKAIMERIEAEIVLGAFDYAKTFPGSKNLEKVACALAEAAAAPLRVLRAGQQEIPTLAAFVEVWWMENEVRWREATRIYHRGFLDKHLLPVFGAQRVDAITRADVLQFRSRLAKAQGRKEGSTLSPKTVNSIMTVLKAILDEAADRHGFSSPCARIDRLKVPRSDIEPFTVDEIRRILAVVRPDFVDYLIVRFYTGMRSGEVHGLKWKLIDWERRQILIRETFSNGRTEYTKTDGSQRAIDMTSLVLEALKRQKGAALPGADYVFTNSAGGAIDNKNFVTRVWNEALKKAGVPLRRPYQARHTFATLMLAAGENPEWIARQLGHTTTEMLFKVYSRYVPNLTRRDGAAFEQLLASAQGYGVAGQGTAAGEGGAA